VGTPRWLPSAPYGRGIDPTGIAAAQCSLTQLVLSAVSARGADKPATIPVELGANPYRRGQLAPSPPRHTFDRGVRKPG
jgi:hypothetical protein